MHGTACMQVGRKVDWHEKILDLELWLVSVRYHKDGIQLIGSPYYCRRIQAAPRDLRCMFSNLLNDIGQNPPIISSRTDPAN